MRSVFIKKILYFSYYFVDGIILDGVPGSYILWLNGKQLESIHLQYAL